MADTILKRDDQGLWSHLSYPRLPSGRINWRAMISPTNLYVNPDYEEELIVRFGVKNRREIPVEKVPDNQLLVTLDGWRELCWYRGVLAMKTPILSASDSKAYATCEIQFVGNVETGMQPVTWSDGAGASVYNVAGRFQLHLEAMAINRAFARCVRTFLNVPIYGKDEFDPEANKAFEAALKKGENPLIAPKVLETEVTSSGPKPMDGSGLLKETCKGKKISFEALKTRALERTDITWKEDPARWTDFTSIAPLDAYTLLALIEEATAKKAKKAS